MFPRRQNPTQDRISRLPDYLLYRILSFLPTKDAVATGVLSRRWRPLCLSLPTFDFDDQSFPTFQHFLHSLYSLFLSRRIDLPLRTFRLKCGHTSPCDPYDINRFVYAAVQRGLRHLHLEMSHTFRIKLPPCVLTCTTLTVLKLKCLILDDDLSDVVFPSLETLHLDWVTFPDHGYLMKLIYACPILEDLKTKDLVVRNGHVWEGELESLPKLLRADISNLDSPFNMLRNAYFLRAELKCAYVSEVPSFPNLTQMELIFEFSKSQWDWFVETLRHCPKLQNLTIDKALKNRDRICDDDWKAPLFVPECLLLQLRTCLLRHYAGMKCELQFAEYVIQNAKVLRTMTIQSNFSEDVDRQLQMLTKISVCPRGSATCKVIFE